MPVICRSCGTQNPDEARFCFSCATPVSGPPIRSERKYATALFADVVGSTALGEREDPEVVRNIVGGTLERAAGAIRRHGGSLEKFMGDGFLAVFGVPKVHEDDAERAVRAGLEIQAMLDQADRRLGERNMDPLRMRIGIESGEVLTDVGAEADLRDRMLTGDAINTAARLQSAADPGAVVVGPSVYDATKDIAEYRALTPLALKGKAQPVPAWEALRIRPSRRERVGLRARLIGRDEELADMTRALDGVRSTNRPMLITILGSAGVGKSRLVFEFLRRVEESPEPLRVRRGRCLSYGNVSYSALAETVKAECGLGDDDSPDSVLERVGKTVEELFGDRALAPQIGALVGSTPTRAFGRDDLFTAWRRFLECVAARSPLVLVLEDIHWADDGLLDFIEHCAEWAEGPLAILALARPELLEERPKWGSAGGLTVSLEPLTPAQTAALLDDLLSAPLPDELRRVVVERSEGNPLFGEEIVRMLVDRSVVRLGEAGWEATGSLEIEAVPRSIHGLIAARLDALAEEEKAVVQRAAVVGRTFWTDIIAGLSSLDVRSTEEILGRLRDKQIVVPVRDASLSGEVEYVFRHVLIRDVAYESLPKSLRADTHVEVARWIEQKAGPRRDEMAERLATHYRESLAYRRALGQELPVGVEAAAYRWARAAGDRSLRLWERREAIRWFQTALDVGVRIGMPAAEEAAVRESLAHASEGVRSYAEVASAYERALALYDAAGDAAGAGRVEAQLSYVAFQGGRDDQVLPHAQRALELLEPLGESRDLTRALSTLGWYHRRRARFAEAEPLLRRATEMAGRVGDRIAQAEAMSSLGKMLQQAGRPEEGLPLMEEGVVVARAAGDLTVLLPALVYLSEAHEEATGDYRRAEALMREGLRLAERAGNLHQIAWTAGNLADYLIDMGRLEEAEPAARRGLDAARAVGESPRIGLCLDCTAYLHALRGRLDEAEATLEELRSIIEQNPEPYIEGWEPLVSGLIAQKQRRADEAVEILADGARRLGDRIEVWGGQNLLLECVRALVRAGRSEEATPFVRQLERLASTRVPPRAFLAWARGLLEPDPRAAQRILAEAVEQFDALGRRMELGRCLLDLAEVERRRGADAAPTLARGREFLHACGAELFLRGSDPA